MPRHIVNTPLKEKENECFQPERTMPYLEETDIIEAFLAQGSSTKLFKKAKSCQLSTADMTKLIFGNQGVTGTFYNKGKERSICQGQKSLGRSVERTRCRKESGY